MTSSVKSRMKFGGMMLAGSITLGFSVAQCAGKRVIDMGLASFASASEVRDKFADLDQRHYRESLAKAYDFKDLQQHVFTTDSIVRCMRATQLKRPVCE